MAKVSGKRIEGFLRQPDPNTVAVLLFGPDRGLVGERAGRLVVAVAGDADDPFRVVEISGADILADPPRLADEAAQLTMTGGRRVVRVRDATDGIARHFEAWLGDAGGDSLVIAEAGVLGKRSALRGLFEKAKNAAAIGCYEDGPRELQAVIREHLARHGARATPDAEAYLAANLGGDRMVSRSELEKLVLYAGGSDGAAVTIGLDDAMAVVGDSAAASLDAIAYATGGGDAPALERALERALAEGATPVGVLRAVQRHLQRLHVVRGMVERGDGLARAMASLRPPVIFLFEARFKDQAGRWPRDRLAAALEMATEAEIDCKSTGFPARAGCHRALMRIAQEARSGGRSAA